MPVVPGIVVVSSTKWSGVVLLSSVTVTDQPP
jgi:hypothetical protein